MISLLPKCPCAEIYMEMKYSCQNVSSRNLRRWNFRFRIKLKPLRFQRAVCWIFLIQKIYQMKAGQNIKNDITKILFLYRFAYHYASTASTVIGKQVLENFADVIFWIHTYFFSLGSSCEDFSPNLWLKLGQNFVGLPALHNATSKPWVTYASHTCSWLSSCQK